MPILNADRVRRLCDLGLNVTEAATVASIQQRRADLMQPMMRAKPPEVRAQDGEMEILIYDAIDWLGVSAEEIARALADAGDVQTIRVRINSPGGDVFDGLAIRNMLQRHAARVEVVVEGVAASAASIIAMAGDEIVMDESAMMMIHNAWAMTIGDHREHTDTAEILTKLDGQIAGIYAARSGAKLETAREWMAAETWFTGEEAVEQGLADRVEATADGRAKAEILPMPWAAHPPASIRARQVELDWHALDERIAAVGSALQYPAVE